MPDIDVVRIYPTSEVSDCTVTASPPVPGVSPLASRASHTVVLNVVYTRTLALSRGPRNGRTGNGEI